MKRAIQEKIEESKNPAVKKRDPALNELLTKLYKNASLVMISAVPEYDLVLYYNSRTHEFVTVDTGKKTEERVHLSEAILDTDYDHHIRFVRIQILDRRQKNTEDLYSKVKLKTTVMLKNIGD